MRRKSGATRGKKNMKALDADPARFSQTTLTVPRPRIPDDMKVRRELGKGSNNKVFAATWRDHEVVLRAPRRKSDTQQKASAVWEFRHTLKASQLGVGPLVYDAWYAKHAKDEWPSGLYVVTERLDCDLHTALCDDAGMRKRLLPHVGALGDALLRCLHTLADNLIFVYDLKPSNIMVGLGETRGVDVRVIDFGRDFCEWAGCEHDPDSRTPIVDMLRKRVIERDGKDYDRQLVPHLLFVSMLVVLSATTTYVLYEDRDDHRMTAAERALAHPLAQHTRALLDTVQGRNLALVREVLRTDEVRGVLRHYHGRRNAGTRRTLRYAKGVEV
jgi:hypothetical protein